MLRLTDVALGFVGVQRPLSACHDVRRALRELDFSFVKTEAVHISSLMIFVSKRARPSGALIATILMLHTVAKRLFRRVR